MKNLIFLLALLSASPDIFADNNQYYYWYKGEKQPLILKENKTLLLLGQQLDAQSLSDLFNVNKDKISLKTRRVDVGESHIPGSQKSRNIYWAVFESRLETVNLSRPEVVYYAPFFEGENGKEMGLSHIFYVKLNQKQEKEELERLAAEHNVKILHNNKYRQLWYTLACDRNSTGDALEMANLFYESGIFSASEPGLVPTAASHTVNDPYFNDQWSLKNTGQYGGVSEEDIQVVDSWKITKSHSAITVAIVDDGVELNHPDLPNMHPFSYDTKNGSSPSQIYDPHGTAIAGIVGANTGNSEGVAGIAPQGKLMSISIDFYTQGNIIEEAADGIDQAWQSGADVINNSWGYFPPSQQIDDAIENAVTLGRGGLGSVVVFSTGNLNSSVLSYPSSNSHVIAVGATSMCGERASPTSCDTENWGSHYGSGLDVMAPGVLIPTTDLQNTSGYNSGWPLHLMRGGTLITDDYYNKDYTIWLNGTSAAAPHVSGIASLILSINDDLTVQEVRYAIESTAEKVGGYTYTMNSGEQSGLTWNSEMGYGRVNAYKALLHTIENHGVHLGVEMSQVRLPLYDDLMLQRDITLESGSNLTIAPQSNLTIYAAGSPSMLISATSSLTIQSSGKVTITKPSGSVTIGGGSTSSAKVAAQEVARPPEISGPSGTRSPYVGILLISRIADGAEVALHLIEEAPVLIEAYDLTGKKVNLPMTTRLMSAGTHTVHLPLRKNHLGIAYLRVNAGNNVYQGIIPPL